MAKKMSKVSKKKQELPTFKIFKRKAQPLPEVKNIRVRYALIPPFAGVNIGWNQEKNEMIYNVREPELTDNEKQIKDKVVNGLLEVLDIELSAIKNKGEAIGYLEGNVKKILEEYQINLSDRSYLKIMYYIFRDFVGLNEIEPILQDPYVEDISCDGVGIPIYVVHRRYGSIKTNVFYNDIKQLTEFVVKLAERSGRFISYAEPLLDGSLPDGSRVQASFAKDVTTRGPSFTIRKFSQIPLSPIDLINRKTVSSEVLAYLWLAVENGASVLIAGGAGTGKTTILNVLSMFIPPTAKVISIEDSVLPDAEIIAEIEGKFTKLKIGSLVENVLKNGKITLPDGTEVGKSNNIKVFSVNKDGKIELKSPSSFIRHRISKKVLDIKFASGRSVSVTKDHSLFYLDNKCNISSISGEEIRNGMFLATPRKLPINCSNFSINILEHPDIFLNTIIKNNGSPSRIYERNTFGLPQNLDMDINLSTLVGIWLADGSYDKNSIIFSTDDSEGREIISLFVDSIGLKAKKHSDGISIMINSSMLKKLFRKLLNLDGDAYTKRVPEWAFDLPDDKVAALLRGYFSGDGCVKKYEVSVSSSSRGLLNDIQSLLLRFGIPLRISNRISKDGTTEARISGVKFLKVFMNNIGFLQQYKKEGLEKACNRGLHDVSDIIPLPKQIYKDIKRMLKPQVGKRIKYVSWETWLSDYLYKQNSDIGREYLKSILESVDERNEVFEKLSKLASNDIFWDKAVEVKERDYDGYVYDISVPENENFICNNILLHNTRELNLTHENWVPAVTRISFMKGVGEVSMFDLLRASFRQTPDYVIVGEIRGKEAYVMFQGMASGIPAMGTMHAGRVEDVIYRLETPPINLSPSLVDTLDLIIVMTHAREKGESARRVKEIDEIQSVDPETGKAREVRYYYWLADKDDFGRYAGDSWFLQELSRIKGQNINELRKEIERRKAVLEWMQNKKITYYKDVALLFSEYYKDPKRILERAGIIKKRKMPQKKHKRTKK